MKRKQKTHITLAVVAIVIFCVILILFLKGNKKSSEPVPTELSQQSQSFLKEIGVDPTETNRHVVIANNKFVTTSGTMTFSENKDENIFVFSNNDGDNTQVRVLEQPKGANVAVGFGIEKGRNVGISLPLPGTYTFGLQNNPSATYTLSVAEPKQ